jgi:hypothetical protein
MAELPPAAVKLLRDIAEHDIAGSGVLFQSAPYGRYRNPHTGSVYNGRTFWPLTGSGLVRDPGDDSLPVTITEAGRRWLAESAEQAGAPSRRQQATPPGAAPTPES